MRALAKRLGVQAPALYWRVRDKQELLDEMGTEIQRRVNAAIAARPVSDHWQRDLAAYARALRSEYLAHRDGARTFSGTRITDPAVLRAQEPWLERWTATGLSLADAVDAAELVTAFVVGFVIEEQERRQSDQSDRSRYSLEQRDAMLGDAVPLVVAAAHARGESDHRFERQLDMLLAGLTARLTVHGRPVVRAEPSRSVGTDRFMPS